MGGGLAFHGLAGEGFADDGLIIKPILGRRF
jgi:hypothetical protein